MIEPPSWWTVVAFVVITGLSVMLAFWPDPATIGGHKVPGSLACSSEEVIDFNDEHELVCIHRDLVRNENTPQ